ncbi:4272_t:CDS:2, partial [Funneliformis geosporum]
MSFSDNALNLIAEAYPNLKYLNLWNIQAITDKGLCVIAQSYRKLEFLYISYCKDITDESLFEIAENCHLLQEFHIAEAHCITDKSISYIINSCPNLQNLDIAYSKEDIKDASMLLQRCLSIEYLNFSGAMALWNDELIIAIIKGFLNLRYLEIGHNDIGDEIIEALAYTCHNLEHLELDGCSFVSELSISELKSGNAEYVKLKAEFINSIKKDYTDFEAHIVKLKHLSLEQPDRLE